MSTMQITFTLPTGQKITREHTGSGCSIYDGRVVPPAFLVEVADALQLPGVREGIAFGVDHLAYVPTGVERLFRQIGTVSIRRAVEVGHHHWDYTQNPVISCEVEVITDYR